MLSSESLRTSNGIVYTNTVVFLRKKKQPFISHVIHVSLELIGSVKGGAPPTALALSFNLKSVSTI